jgi:hypothetical protein
LGAGIWKNKSNKRATNATYLQTTAVNQAIKTQLQNIATVYYQLLSVDAQIKVAEEKHPNRILSKLLLRLKKNVTEVGVKQKRKKYATQIIIADLGNIIILENTMSILLGDHRVRLNVYRFESQSMQPEITLGVPASC